MSFGSGPMNKYDYACTVASAWPTCYCGSRMRSAWCRSTARSEIAFRSAAGKAICIRSSSRCRGASRRAKRRSTSSGQVAEEQSLRGMIVLISDLFVDPQLLDRGLSLLRHRGHDVMVFHILDDEELDFNFSGTTKFEGLEETRATSSAIREPSAKGIWRR